MNEIKNGNLYILKSPLKKNDVLVEILNVGIVYLLVNIYKKGKGKKGKTQRMIDINNNGFDFSIDTLMLTTEFGEEYNKLKKDLIDTWIKKGV